MSKKRRRTKGTGSVYTRKDGRVVGEYDANGRTRFIYGRDEGEVADRVAEAIKHRDAGIDSDNMTVGGYMDRWLTAIRDTVRVGESSAGPWSSSNHAAGGKPIALSIAAIFS